MDLERRSHTPKGRLARERILRVAEKLLAQRGFHGTSMRDVADGCEVPLASVVYHFARKEHLYAAVLGAIAAELDGEMKSAAGDDRSARSPDHVERLAAMMRAFARWSLRRPDRVRLLVRELLDNEARVAKAQKLPLAPFLESFAAFIAEGARAGAFTVTSALPEVAVLHLVGAVSYFVVSLPTVRRIVGKEREKKLTEDYEAEVIELARRALGVRKKKGTS